MTSGRQELGLFWAARAVAKKFSDSPSIVEASGTLSFAQFHQQVEQGAAWLAGQGIRRGDRIAVWLVNRAEWLVVLFAAARLGASVVSINTRYRTRELGHILEASRARILFMEPRFGSVDFLSVLAGVPRDERAHLECIAWVGGTANEPAANDHAGCTWRTFEPGCQDSADRLTSNAGAPADVSILFPTSGTTGKPKLVMHTQRALTQHSLNVAAAYGVHDRASLLLMLPLCGVFGFNAALTFLLAGRPVITLPTFEASEAIELIRRHRPTHLFGSDEMYARLLAQAPTLEAYNAVEVAGFASFSPGASDVARAGRRAGLPMRGLYGSSEVQALFALQPGDAADDKVVLPGGRPANPRAEIRVVDPLTAAPLALGVAGSLEIRADTNAIGYFENQPATRAALCPDGYYRTGDLGYLCDDGSFVYLSRQGDALRLNGFLVSPVEIEDALLEEPGIVGAQVVGVEAGREVILCAFLVTDKPVEERQVLEGLRRRLSPFKVPSHLWFLPEFPATDGPNGRKVQKAPLRDMALQLLGLSAR